MSQKTQKKTLELVSVSENDVKSHLIAQFDYKFTEKDWRKSKIQNMYELYNKDIPKSCKISVKIPPKHIVGKAIHLNVLFRDNIEGKEWNIYPLKKETGKKGLGHFTSTSIYRNKYWKGKLHLEAQTGIDLCESLYESDSFIDATTRHKLYDLVEKRYQLIEERAENNRKCADLVQPNAILKCKEKSAQLNEEIKRLREEISRYKSPHKIQYD